MAKDYKVGENYYLPVMVGEIMDDTYVYPVRIVFNNGNGNNEGHSAIKDTPGLLLTAEEVAKRELGEPGKDYILVGNHNFMTFPSKTLVVSEEETRIKTLTEEIATLTDERDDARKQADIFQEEIKKLTADRDKFAKTAKDKADLAREAIDHLQEENNKLKREVENRTTDYKLMRDNNAVYLSRIATQNEVINALVEKIRRLEGDET